MSGKITWGVLGKRKDYYKVGFQETPAELTKEEREALVRQQLMGNSWKYEPEKLKPGFGWMGANEKGEVTPQPTPTMTPTPSATCPITTQYLEVQLSDNTKFKLILWNQPNYTSPATASCDYVISGTAYGSLGTTYTGTETILSAQHQHQFDLAPVLLPGEVVVGFDVWSYTASTCVCPINLILPTSVTPTPTPTNTNTPTPTNTGTPTQTPTNTGTPTNTPTNSGTPTPTPTPTSVWATLSGGTETTFVSGSTTWKVHTFNSTQQVSVTKAGLIKYLMIGGGGAGGTGYSNDSGGSGGAGGYLETQMNVTGGTHTITIGAGGASATNGNNTTFYGLTALGGGRGGIRASTPIPAGANGGCGGGGTALSAGGTGSQGGNGGAGNPVGSQRGVGAGGGASQNGGDGLASGTGAKGGDGFQSSINGTLTYRGGGAGAQTTNFTTAGAAGQGGGGFGPVATTGPGTANTGGGGVGGATPGGGILTAGAAGGSGVVILAYQI